MKKQNFGFTLIELLVVIVIIGILATISTATFSGYFAKARDTERQTFVGDVETILVASQVGEDTPDYDLEVNDASATNPTTATSINTAFNTLLREQGLSLPGTKNSIAYYYLINAAVGEDLTAYKFVMFVCNEDKLAATGTSNSAISDSAFVSANISDPTEAITAANAREACVKGALAAPTVESGWTAIALS